MQQRIKDSFYILLAVALYIQLYIYIYIYIYIFEYIVIIISTIKVIHNIIDEKFKLSCMEIHNIFLFIYAEISYVSFLLLLSAIIPGTLIVANDYFAASFLTTEWVGKNINIQKFAEI